MTTRTSRKGAVLALLLTSAGCASFSEDGGFDAVRRLTEERGVASTAWIRDDAARDTARKRTASLLSMPLGIEQAIEIAMLNNPGVQASLAELGIAEADLVIAGTMPNPKFAFQRTSRGEETSIERKFTFDILGIVAIPFVLDIEERRFAQAQARAAIDLLSHASEVRDAYFEAVAARQVLSYAEQVKDIADAGALLGRRMVDAGNWSRLAQAREQAFGFDALNLYERARNAADMSRERLARLLGLGPEARAPALPDRLPDLPSADRIVRELGPIALDRRLDVQMARAEIDGLAKSLGLTQGTRFVNVIEGSYLRGRETAKARETGYEIELSLPLFDWGQARIAKAELLYTQALGRVGEIAINAGSEIRESHASRLSAYEIAKRYRDDVVPLRAAIAEEVLLRYNGMLMSVFELLAETREHIGAVIQAIETLRDFWIADTAFMAATAVGTPAGTRRGPSLGASFGKTRPGH